MTDLVAKFPEISSSADLVVGNSFTFTIGSTLKDGTYLPGVVTIYNGDAPAYFLGYDTDVRTDVQQTGNDIMANFNVACSSDLGGTYLVTTTGFNTDGGCGVIDATVTDYEVTLTDLGGGSYNVSDFSGGIYIAWYACYGGGEQSGTLIDVCGDLSIDLVDPWGASFYITSSTIDDVSGVIIIEWTNDWGDTSTSVYTPKAK